MVQSGIILGVSPDVLRCVEVKVTTLTCEDEDEFPHRDLPGDLLDIPPSAVGSRAPLLPNGVGPARLITAVI